MEEAQAHLSLPSSSTTSVPPPPAAASTAGERDEQEQSAPPPTPRPLGQRILVSYSVSISGWNSTNPIGMGTRSDDTCSCFIVMATFCFFASMTLILGFCGTQELLLGPNTSWLLQANSLFSQDIQVADQNSSSAAVVYGFAKPPPLDVETTWTQTRRLSIPPHTHQEWAFYLNGEAQMNVSYMILEGDRSSSSLSLAIVKGKQSLLEWIEDPLFPDTTLYWNIIQGNGFINQKISRTSDYYVAVANTNPSPVEVYLNFSIQAWLYNTTGAHHKCSLNQSLCVTDLSFFSPNAVIIATSNPPMDGGNEEWIVTVSFSPRWVTYLLGSGIVTLTMMAALRFITNSISASEGHNDEGMAAENSRTPLLSNKDDDDSSRGSSYESVSHDEEEGEARADLHPDAVANEAGKEDVVSERLCVICFDAPKDCFFLPCGHCATCFPCGTKMIAEEAGNCPFCGRRTKKVKRIYTI